MILSGDVEGPHFDNKIRADLLGGGGTGFLIPTVGYDTAVFTDPFGGPDINVMEQSDPTNWWAFALALPGDAYPQWLFPFDTGDGIYFGDGTYDAGDIGMNIYAYGHNLTVANFADASDNPTIQLQVDGDLYFNLSGNNAHLDGGLVVQYSTAMAGTLDIQDPLGLSLHSAGTLNQHTLTVDDTPQVLVDGNPLVATAVNGVPSGGTTGQVLGKISNADYDDDWITISGGGSPAGSDGNVQFNDAGAFGGDSGFTFDNTGSQISVFIGSAAILSGSTDTYISSPAHGVSHSEVFGEGASVSANNGVALGYQANVEGAGGIAIGYQAEVLGSTNIGIAIGHQTVSRSDNGISILGAHMPGVGDDAIAILATVDGSGAFGNSSALAIQQAFAGGEWSVAMSFAYAAGDFSLAMMNNAQALDDYGIALGFAATATGQSSVAIGLNAQATDDWAITIGHYSSADFYGIALGYMSTAGVGGIAIGHNVTATGSQVVIGDSGSTYGFYGVTPVAQAATPTTLAHVITIIRNLGFAA